MEEPLAIFCIISFSLCFVSAGVFVCRQARQPVGMKESPSMENLTIVEDPMPTEQEVTQTTPWK